MTIIVQLGGNPHRSLKTRELLDKYDIDEVVLTGLADLELKQTLEIIDGEVLPIKIDVEALDTLGNFIHTRRWVSSSKVFLVTDSRHLFRSLGLAKLVWGRRTEVIPASEGIEGGVEKESFLYCLVDWTRAIVWKITKFVVVRQPKLKLLRIE